MCHADTPPPPLPPPLALGQPSTSLPRPGGMAGASLEQRVPRRLGSGSFCSRALPPVSDFPTSICGHRNNFVGKDGPWTPPQEPPARGASREDRPLNAGHWMNLVFSPMEIPGWVIYKRQCLGVSMPSRHGVSGVRAACHHAPLFCSCGSSRNSNDSQQTSSRKWNFNPGTWGIHGNVEIQAARQCEVCVSLWTVPRGVRRSTGL